MLLLPQFSRPVVLAINPRTWAAFGHLAKPAIAAADSLLNENSMLKSPFADSFRAELQVLLAEVKRLGIRQERLKQEAADLDTLDLKRPAKSANLRKYGCDIIQCPGPALTVPFGRQWTCGSSDWSEGGIDTPVKNLVSGKNLQLEMVYDKMPYLLELACHMVPTAMTTEANPGALNHDIRLHVPSEPASR